MHAKSWEAVTGVLQHHHISQPKTLRRPPSLHNTTAMKRNHERCLCMASAVSSLQPRPAVLQWLGAKRVVVSSMIHEMHKLGLQLTVTSMSERSSPAARCEPPAAPLQRPALCCNIMLFDPLDDHGQTLSPPLVDVGAVQPCSKLRRLLLRRNAHRLRMTCTVPQVPDSTMHHTPFPSSEQSSPASSCAACSAAVAPSASLGKCKARKIAAFTHEYEMPTFVDVGAIKTCRQLRRLFLSCRAQRLRVAGLRRFVSVGILELAARRRRHFLRRFLSFLLLISCGCALVLRHRKNQTLA